MLCCIINKNVILAWALSLIQTYFWVGFFCVFFFYFFVFPSHITLNNRSTHYSFSIRRLNEHPTDIYSFSSSCETNKKGKKWLMSGERTQVPTSMLLCRHFIQLVVNLIKIIINITYDPCIVFVCGVLTPEKMLRSPERGRS